MKNLHLYDSIYNNNKKNMEDLRYCLEIRAFLMREKQPRVAMEKQFASDQRIDAGECLSQIGWLVVRLKFKKKVTYL